MVLVLPYPVETKFNADLTTFPCARRVGELADILHTADEIHSHTEIHGYFYYSYSQKKYMYKYLYVYINPNVVLVSYSIFCIW